MADGAIKGTIRAVGTFDHTDANPQTVASLTLPSAVDGVYHATARISASQDDGEATDVAVCYAQVNVIAGVALLNRVASTSSLEVAHVAEIDVTGTDTVVRARLTAANLFRSVALIEAFGVEHNITPP